MATLHEDLGLEASVYAHGLHGAGLHNVVQGHIPSRQGSLRLSSWVALGLEIQQWWLWWFHEWIQQIVIRHDVNRNRMTIQPNKLCIVPWFKFFFFLFLFFYDHNWSWCKSYSEPIFQTVCVHVHVCVHYLHTTMQALQHKNCMYDVYRLVHFYIKTIDCW